MTLEINITDKKSDHIDVDFIERDLLVNVTFRRQDVESLVELLVELRKLK